MIFLIVCSSITAIGFFMFLLFKELKKSKNNEEKDMAIIYSPSELDLGTNASSLSNTILLAKNIRHLELISHLETYLDNSNKSLCKSYLLQEINDCKRKTQKQVSNFSQNL